MRKLKKSIILGLSIAALGVSTYNASKTYALENQKNYAVQSEYTKINFVDATNEDELIAALKNPSVKQIILKNDITISKEENEEQIRVEGDFKEIISELGPNKCTISSDFKSGRPLYIGFYAKTYINNVNINNIQITGWDLKIENSYLNNTSIRASYIKNCIIENSGVGSECIEDCKLKNTQINQLRLESDAKITNVDIDNTNTDFRDDEASIVIMDENVTLKNVNIKNKYGKVLRIYSESNVSIEGDLTMETSKSEAILVESPSKDYKARLYINGNLKHIGDTYTIKSTLNGYGTEVYDNNNTLNGSMDKDGTAYYNAKNRVGSEPKLPVNNKNGWAKEDNIWHYYNNGLKRKNWIKNANNWYYLDKDGKMLTGWQMINGSWYYLENSGAMATGWKNSNGTWYYLKSSGAMATGWEKVNGTWYYLKSSGAMAIGWEKVNGTWYYLQNSGAMATGWHKISGKWYYMYGSGAMVTNTVIDGWRINSSGVATKIK